MFRIFRMFLLTISLFDEKEKDEPNDEIDGKNCKSITISFDGKSSGTIDHLSSPSGIKQTSDERISHSSYDCIECVHESYSSSHNKSQGFSGAEIEEAIISAMYAAFPQERDIETQDIIKAMQETVPLSVTYKEKISALREWAKLRARPA